jgi:hypothetical protein
MQLRLEVRFEKRVPMPGPAHEIHRAQAYRQAIASSELAFLVPRPRGKVRVVLSAVIVRRSWPTRPTHTLTVRLQMTCRIRKMSIDRPRVGPKTGSQRAKLDDPDHGAGKAGAET